MMHLIRQIRKLYRFIFSDSKVCFLFRLSVSSASHHNISVLAGNGATKCCPPLRVMINSDPDYSMEG
jgi:hypothetical protein